MIKYVFWQNKEIRILKYVYLAFRLPLRAQCVLLWLVGFILLAVFGVLVVLSPFIHYTSLSSPSSSSSLIFSPISSLLLLKCFYLASRLPLRSHEVFVGVVVFILLAISGFLVVLSPLIHYTPLSSPSLSSHLIPSPIPSHHLLKYFDLAFSFVIANSWSILMVFCIHIVGYFWRSCFLYSYLWAWAFTQISTAVGKLGIDIGSGSFWAPHSLGYL